MISLDKCKTVLRDSKRKFTDEEIKMIRDFLYEVTSVEYEQFKALEEHEGDNIYEGLD